MRNIVTHLLLCLCGSVWSQPKDGLEAVKPLWLKPTSEYCMKTWWFFGFEQTTDEGITADVEALREAGFGGVVYYDQNHAKDAEANGAEAAFSQQWWHHLEFAAQEARRCGLSFEELFYIANKEYHAVSIGFHLRQAPRQLTLWRNADGSTRTLRPDANGQYTLTLKPTESVFISYPRTLTGNRRTE